MSDTAEPEDGSVEVDRPRPGGRAPAVVALVLAVVLALLVAVLATRDPATERAGESPLFGHLAPATEGRTLDGGTVSIDDLRGRWVVVNFFASWCVPCIQEHPELEAFEETHRAAGDAAVVGVTFDDEEADARAFFAKRGGSWPVIVDPDNSIGVAYGVAKVPESFVVAPNGTVVHRFAGGVEQEDLEEVIEFYEREPR